MNETNPTIESAEESPETPKKLYWLSGALESQQAGGQIKGSLGKKHGQGNYEFVHSMISGDKTSVERYQRLKADIVEQIEKGKEVIIVAHSFGAQELYELIKELEKDPENEKYFEKITIVLLSPYGVIEGWLQLPRLLQVLNLFTSLTPLGPFARFRYSLESFNFFPAENMTNDELEVILREFFPEKSRYLPYEQKNTTAVTSMLAEEGFFMTLDEGSQSEIRDKVRTIDEKIKICGNRKASRVNKLILRNLLRRRSLAIKDAVAEAYTGGEEEPTQSMIEMYKVMAQAGLGIASLLKKMMTGEVTSALRRVREKGATIKAVMPEYDVIYSVKEFMELLQIDEEEALELIAFLTAATHSSFVINAAGVVEAVAELVGD
ncbi:MAG: hypothetical protein PVJ09_00355 [Candidatus Woesebacteria bacterium]|jgi:hypothetical protein